MTTTPTTLTIEAAGSGDAITVLGLGAPVTLPIGRDWTLRTLDRLILRTVMDHIAPLGYTRIDAYRETDLYGNVHTCTAR